MRSRLARGCLAAGLALAASLPQEVQAYCRTSACGEGVQGTRCEPPEPGDCGTPLAWDRDCIGWSVHEDGSPRNNVSAKAARNMLVAAAGTWLSADCRGETPRMRIQDLGEVACDKVEYNQDRGNANVVVFRDTVWPHEGMLNALALTTVTYDVDSGEIYDADIEVNGARDLLAPDTVPGDEPPGSQSWYDLPSILTHEMGHGLGLAHSTDPTAVMRPLLEAGDISVRFLNADDVAGICAIYPPGELDDDCNPIPRHGFSDECRRDQFHADCGVARSQGGEGALLLGLVAIALGRRRRR
jgi:hypothetical protein